MGGFTGIYSLSGTPDKYNHFVIYIKDLEVMISRNSSLLKAFISAILLAIILVPQLSAQEEEKSSAIFINANYLYSIEFAHSKSTYDFTSVGLGYERMCADWWSFKLLLEPLVWGSGEEEDRIGSGLSGFYTVYFNQSDDYKPFVEFEGGVILFDDPVPIAEATQFNFALGLGAGVDIPVNDVDFIEIAYRFRHYSNSNMGDRNPAVNGHLFSIGYKHKF